MKKEGKPNLENLLSDSVTNLEMNITQKGKLVYYTSFMVSPDNAIEILIKLYEFIQKLHRKGDFF